MTTTTAPNGRPRRQLADQLDRLDGQMDRADRILDALSEGLDGAVRDATREGTRLAVKEAVIELLTDPDLRASLHQASAPPARARPSAWQRLTAGVRRARARAADAVRATVAAGAARVTCAAAAVGRLMGRVRASA